MTITEKIERALKELEAAYEQIIVNTNTKTFKVDKQIGDDIHRETNIKRLERIALLTRRLEREVRQADQMDG
jgi:hypothetical protein